jgi:hypothetical protein
MGNERREQSWGGSDDEVGGLSLFSEVTPKSPGVAYHVEGPLPRAAIGCERRKVDGIEADSVLVFFRRGRIRLA